MARAKPATGWALVGVAAGALAGFVAAAAYVEHVLPGQLTGSRPDSDAGTEVCLSGTIDAPDLDQKGLIGESFYPCGKEAAVFLKKLIGDQPVTFIGDHTDEERVGKNPAGSCFVGETNLEIEMIRNGWALSGHSRMDAWEIIARENKRGLWRGKFIVPKRWREGERLSGE